MKKIIATERAPKAIGPYSQGILAAGALYISGQLPADPVSGALGEGIAQQTARALDNLGAILEAAGMGYANVVKTTVLLADMNDFAAMNEVYARYFGSGPSQTSGLPTRACYQVARLPKDALIEIEAIAVAD